MASTSKIAAAALLMAQGATADCLRGDVMLFEGQHSGFIGKTCLGRDQFSGTETVCRNGKLVEQPYLGSCFEVGPGFECVQEGAPGSYGGAVCIIPRGNSLSGSGGSTNEWQPASALNGRDCMSTYMAFGNTITCTDGTTWTDNAEGQVRQTNSVSPSSASTKTIATLPGLTGTLSSATLQSGSVLPRFSFPSSASRYYPSWPTTSPYYPSIPSFPNFPAYPYPSYPPANTWGGYPPYPSYPWGPWGRDRCADQVDPCFSPDSYCCRVQKQGGGRYPILPPGAYA
jgi:hypothetical protein